MEFAGHTDNFENTFCLEFHKSGEPIGENDGIVLDENMGLTIAHSSNPNMWFTVSLKDIYMLLIGSAERQGAIQVKSKTE